METNTTQKSDARAAFATSAIITSAMIVITAMLGFYVYLGAPWLILIAPPVAAAVAMCFGSYELVMNRRIVSRLNSEGVNA